MARANDDPLASRSHDGSRSPRGQMPERCARAIRFPWIRRDVVAVTREGEVPLSQVAKDFGISESCPHRWLRHVDVDDDDGVRPVVTSSASAVLRELRKRNERSATPGSAPSPSERVAAGTETLLAVSRAASRRFSRPVTQQS